MPYKDEEKAKAAKRRYEERRKGERSKRKDFFLFIFYPDSAPENWKEIIDGWQVDVLVSPLHDQDTDPDGKLKKPHWHGIVFFDSKKQLKDVVELIKDLKGPAPKIPAGSKRTAALYLIHRNNPDKHQYDKADVLEFGSARFDVVVGASDTDDSVLCEEMMDWCKRWECYSFAKLCDYAVKNNTEWFMCLMKRQTYFMSNYLKSLYNDEKHTDDYYPYSKFDVDVIAKFESKGYTSTSEVSEDEEDC